MSGRLRVRGHVGCARGRLVVLGFVIVAVFCTALFSTAPSTGPTALQAAETAPNSSLFLAQTQPKKSPRDLRLKTRKPASRSPAGARSPAAARSTESNDDAKPEGEETERADKKSPGFFKSLIAGIREHAIWIVIVLVCAIAGVLIWVLMGRGSTGAFEEELGEGGLAATPASSGREKRYSTTKIQAREVNDRLALDSTEVETDREYALVVDEDALKKPEVDERTGQVYADSADISELLADEKFEDAYDTYAERLRSAEIVEFHSEVEKTLSDHFLDSREFDKAARILEHHVATHAAADIAPDTYFNLGYIHFFNQRVKKSRRFLKLYLERESDPTRVNRARRILDALDESSA